MYSGAQMSFSDSVFYYWSDKEWDSCDKFRSAATGVLNPKGFPGMLEWSGSDTTVCEASPGSSGSINGHVNAKCLTCMPCLLTPKAEVCAS